MVVVVVVLNLFPHLPLPFFFLRVRHHSAPIPCTGTATDKHQVQICFQEPRLRIAPGQVVSLYVGEECLGGGIVLNHQ